MTRYKFKSEKSSQASSANTRRLQKMEKQESASLALSLLIVTSIITIITLLIIVNTKSKYGHIHIPFEYVFIDAIAILATAWVTYRWLRIRKELRSEKDTNMNRSKSNN